MLGKFIVFEGTDGAGKTTQLKKLVKYLEAKSMELLLTREPGGTPAGNAIRNTLLDCDFSPTLSDTTQLLLFAAAYRDTIHQLIVPGLQAGKVVLSDRTNITSFVFQRRSPWIRQLCQINDDLLQPDIVFILTTDYETMRDRIDKSDRGYSNYKDFATKEDHDFRVEGYRLYAEQYPRHTVVLNSAKTPDEIFEDVLKVIEERFQL